MPRDARRALATLVVALVGANYVLSGAALLVAPEWFFANVGPYPPFNRHYLGDLGAFLLPLGVGLLVAARHPARHATVLAVAVGASALHALNHLYDAVVQGAPLAHWLADTAPLLLLAALLALAGVPLREAPPTARGAASRGRSAGPIG